MECLTTEQRQILLSVYCISGCDTTSSLFGIGKKKVFKVMLSCAKDFQKIAGMGTDDNLSVETRYECVKFIGILYGASNCTSLNRLRTENFWLVVFGLNDPLRQYFSLYRVVSQREGERAEMTDESKNV